MLISAHKLRAKIRSAVRRREEEVEEEEIQGGELNLIPYLDIVTNLMIFLLATISSVVLLGQIDTKLPDKSPAAAVAAPDPAVKPEDQPLKLVVSVTTSETRLWSMTGLEGSLLKPKLRMFRNVTYQPSHNVVNPADPADQDRAAPPPDMGRIGDRCDGNYMCETSSCDTLKQVCIAAPPPEKDRAPDPATPVYDYRALNQALMQIAADHYNNKNRVPATYQAILMVDPTIPYMTVMAMMSAMRCKLPEFGKASAICLMPSVDEATLKATEPVNPETRLYDTARAPYNADSMALFHEILFSGGLQ